MSRPICAGCGHDLAYHTYGSCTICEAQLGICCATAPKPQRQLHPATLLGSDAQAWNAPGELWRSRRKETRR